MENNSILVSVIIPAYNVEKYIAKCLDSLINQSLKDIEIIIIDDGSTDKTPFIIKDYANQDKRIKVIAQTNQKQGAARNRGLEAASGEYIGFVDADDWVDLNYFEKLYETAKKYNSDIALATNIRIGSKKTKKRINIKYEIVSANLKERFKLCNLKKDYCPTNKIYKNSLLKKNNILFAEGVFCEDKIFTCKAVYYANTVVTVPDIYYYYFRNPKSTVNTKNPEHIDDKNNAKRTVVEFLREQKASVLDCDFWYTKTKIKILGIPLLIVNESLFSRKYIILGFINWCVSEI